MELHEKHTHHVSRDQIISDSQVDRWGQPILIRGLGFRGPNIYQPEQGRHDPAELYHRLFIEAPDGTVWHVEPARPRTLEALLRLRDQVWPTGTVVAWTGHWQDLRRVDDPDWGTGYKEKGVRRTYPPKSVTVTDPKACRAPSKGKAKRRSCKIRRAV